MADKTCPKCGETKPIESFGVERSRKDGRYPSCRDCGKAYRAQHYAENKGRILAQHATYRAAIPEVIRERKAKYYAENREAINGRTSERYAAKPDRKLNYQKVYQGANPHVQWAASYRRRMKRKGLEPGIVELFSREDVVAIHGDSCFYCPDGAFEQLDHYIPLGAHGDHTLENVRPACEACNVSKRNHDAEEWQQSHSIMVNGGDEDREHGSATVTEFDRAALADLYEGSK